VNLHVLQAWASDFMTVRAMMWVRRASWKSCHVDSGFGGEMKYDSKKSYNERICGSARAHAMIFWSN
jgi:hypothetical protein